MPSLSSTQSVRWIRSRERSQAIVLAAERSADLTKQLLAFARKQVVAPVVMNLNDALSALQSMLTRLVGEDIAISRCGPEEISGISRSIGLK